MINIQQKRLTPPVRRTLAGLLEDAFHEDRAMTGMLGARRWQRIARRYFAIQLDYSDTILTAEADGVIVGALLARSPSAQYGWRSVWMFAVMMLLLGRHYAQSQRIGYALIDRLPAESHWYINQLAVLPRYQSRGIGESLLTALNESTGAELVCVDCDASLQGFYEASGFTLLAAIPDYSLRIMARRGAGFQVAQPAV